MFIMWKKLALGIISCGVIMSFLGCGGSGEQKKQAAAATVASTNGKTEITFPFEAQAGDSSNQFAVWIEDAQGNYVKTLAATSYTVRKGVQKTYLLPTWVGKSKLAGMQKAEVDALTLATPKSGKQSFTWDGKDASGKMMPSGDYKYVVEGIRFMSNRVVYTGQIKLGKEAMTNVAKKEVIKDDGKNANMIGEVKAVYTPAK